jgi:hypothetical protein
MKKLLIFSILITFIVGCGSSGGFTSSTTPGLGQAGNFVTTTVEAEQRFLYTLDSVDGTISAYVYPADEEEEGHGHAHGRVFAQQVDHEEDDHGEEGHEEDDHGEEGDHDEEGPEAVELDPSPFNLNHSPIDIGVVDDSFLLTLDAGGVVRTYLINGNTGLLEFTAELDTNTFSPRRLIVSDAGVAVLGDQLRIYQVNSSGSLSAPAFLDGTATWVDVDLDGPAGVAATPDGAVGFTWRTGSLIEPLFPLSLPGATRGELVYAPLGVFVLNSADGSMSLLSQDGSGELTLEETFALGGELTNPTLITNVFEGEDLLVADEDSVTLFHPEPGELEDEGTAELSRQPVRLFFLPESEAVYVGHSSGLGTTTVLIEPTGPEVLEGPGPGGLGASAFGYVERLVLITETGGFE